MRISQVRLIALILIPPSIFLAYGLCKNNNLRTHKSIAELSQADKDGLEIETDRYNRAVKSLNEGWNYIRMGDSYARQGDYDKAVEAYKQAYEIDPGNGLMSGSLLIETYEKQKRYQEALAVVDDILKTKHLGPSGIEKYKTIRMRLINNTQAQSS